MSFSGFTSPRGSDSEHQDLADINMIPLIDVMLVLLIVFMLAAPLSISGIKVQLPQSRAKGNHVDGEKIVLSINAAGKYFIDKLEIAPHQLEEKISALYQVRDDKSLYIRADKSVAYGRVVDAMGKAKLAGVTKLAMLTTPPVPSTSRR